MARSLYEDGGGVLTSDGTMTLAMGTAYGGSTVVYTGTSLIAPERVIEGWDVPGLEHDDVERRSRKYMEQNNVHFLDDHRINENNQLFVRGCEELGLRAEQFPVNVKGCRGSSLCNLGCPNQAKQGTNRVQLPAAECRGVEVVTRCEVARIGDRQLFARVHRPGPDAKGEPPEWEPGDYRIRAKTIVLSAGAVHTPALLLRSQLPVDLPRLGRGFTCHPALILVGRHPRPITNFVGHPKSYYLDQFAETDRYLLETCMYFPFVTAKSLAGFGAEHSAFMRAFPRLQMILVLACDRAHPDNRVTVDGIGRPRVEYEFTPEVRRALVRGTLTSAEIFFAAGAEAVHAPVSPRPTLDRSDADRLEELARDWEFVPGKTTVSAAHLQGGCGMGRTTRDSVTDSWGRVHGIPWLYVADASLFPDAVEINPYLTIMALADRVAEGIRGDAARTLN